MARLLKLQNQMERMLGEYCTEIQFIDTISLIVMPLYIFAYSKHLQVLAIDHTVLQQRTTPTITLTADTVALTS